MVTATLSTGTDTPNERDRTLQFGFSRAGRFLWISYYVAADGEPDKLYHKGWKIRWPNVRKKE